MHDKQLITGLHHVTCLSSDPQKNVNFYAGILGLRLVKKTVNYDATEIYHLYFGNEKGSPGTIITFFPYPGIPKGRKGKGQLTVTSFSIPENAIDYWLQRLKKFNVKHQKPAERFDEQFIYFEDFDGLGLELVVNNKDRRPGFTYGNVPEEFAIKGFYGITLSEECYEKTAELLTDQLDHALLTEKGHHFRFAPNSNPSSFVDIVCNPETLLGQPGYGTVHHVAFATATDATQLEARKKLEEAGLNVTPVINRNYFHSIYFREPGGVLFEIATIPPGFAIDEPFEHLGESFQVPPWEKENRKKIEAQLIPVELDIKAFAD
ncbi:MAG TPA: ring-cleaving dioxygenase [Rhabdochlamydiaceae bacterium]|nr:ring-cleaving dioxygenase [Rhabdochlamydiaceae bacterium]